jgi:hypothetical protein
VLSPKSWSASAARSNSVHSSPRSCNRGPSISTIDCGEADCTIKQSSSGPSNALSARAVNGGCVRKTPHRHRQADLPSILDCKARAPPCQLTERPSNKRAASAARVPHLQLVGRRALAVVLVVQLCSQQTDRCTLCTPRSSRREPAGGHGVLKSIWMQRPAGRQMRLFVSPPRGIHRHAGNAEASAASGSVLDRLGGATCAQPSYVRL